MNKEILSNINVLYVEDENDVREFTSKLLSSLVKKVYSAKNGLDGLNQFKANSNDIDLIVTDINMPKMNGLEMCTEIKKINISIPVIVTSAHNDPSFLNKAINAGIGTYTMKPIDLYQLVECMIKVFEPIYLIKKIQNLNISLQNDNKDDNQKIKTLLDTQKNIVVLLNKEGIKNANTLFYDFFEIKTIEEFTSLKKSIFDFFIDDYGLINKEKILKEECSFKYIQNLPETNRITKMLNSNNEERVFTINIDNYNKSNEFYILCLSDITQLKEKSNLLEYQASYDNVTGLYNRNKFYTLFGKEIRRAKRYSNNLALILLSTDLYEHIDMHNEEEKSNKGIKQISNIISNTLREHDTLVRWSEKEFLVLLPETSLKGCSITAQKIKETLLKNVLSTMNINIQTNFAVTILKEDDDEQSFISRVTKAL